MKVIITKWVLTKGPIVTEVVLTQNPKVVKIPNWLAYFFGEGREWHRTKESAKTRIEAMFQRKEASLRKQLNALAEKETEALAKLSELKLE